MLGFCLGAYQYAAHIQPKRSPALLADADGHADALSAARATWLARDLVNAPANHLGPADLAAATLAIAGAFGAEGLLVEGDALAREYGLDTVERGTLSSVSPFCDGLLRKTRRTNEPPGPLPKRILIVDRLKAGAMTGKQAQRMPTAGSMAVQMTRSASSPWIGSVSFGATQMGEG